MSFVVGFDLDMTLVDSRAGIVACMQRTLGDRGVAATDEQLWPLIGAPLADNLAQFLPADQVPGAVEQYRALYPELAVPMTTALPGAHDAFAAIREHGGQPMVVSAKYEPAVHAVLHQVGLQPDIVVGDAFGAGKAVPIKQHHATIFVGDHEGDMAGAVAGGAYALGVLTGPHDEAQLRAAGAQSVVPDLRSFGPWLNDYLSDPPAR
ncbi:HAD family hydrolase [Branchiibius cervicis]|uniref:HAD family hydrolase n=1 Tax=Branchiibius cervicis TaxID=908252 RepID=A0ABW2APA1_9MICO